MLNGLMKRLAFRGVGSLVVDLFPLPTADDQPAGPQLVQVVGHGGAGHIHQRRQIDDALLSVAQQPENFQPVRVVQLLKQVRRPFKGLHRRHFFFVMLKYSPMIVGQTTVGHGVLSFLGDAFSFIIGRFHQIYK